MNELIKKRSKKEFREEKVLFGLIELFLKTGKPIGSQTLQEQGFEDLSSATIRNYFGELEARGYLKQSHISGGRVPTSKAYRHYAQAHISYSDVDPEIDEQISVLKQGETKHLTSYLNNAAELLSELTGYATFLSSVRFDHDFILDIKLVSIDASRILCVLITDFGQILTETLSYDRRLSSFTLKRIEAYFQWKLKGGDPKEKAQLLPEEENIAKEFYTEIMIRYLARYSNYSEEEVYRTGFSKLIKYPEFHDPVALSQALALFENESQMRLLLNDCVKKGRLTFWIGSDLSAYSVTSSGCSVIAIPYRINQQEAGAIGILGPSRMPYKTLFGILQPFSQYISDTVTKSLYKFKLSYRHPRSSMPYLESKSFEVDEDKSFKLLESKEM